MKNGSKVLIALAAGLAAGAILGVLFAPDGGKETRKKIVDSGKDLVDSGKDLFDGAKKKIYNGASKIAELKEEALRKAEHVI